jgi:hypothetical protein
MSPKGKVVTSVPRSHRRSDQYDWDAMALLAKMNAPNSVLAAKAVRHDLIKSVRRYTREPFITPEGHIVVNMRGSHTTAQGTRVGDVYFTWVSNEEQKEN